MKQRKLQWRTYTSYIFWLNFKLIINILHSMLQLQPREREAFHYNEKLKEKFAHHPQVKRIARHRHVPKPIYNAQREHAIIKQSKKRKYVLSYSVHYLTLLFHHCIFYSTNRTLLTLLGSHEPNVSQPPACCLVRICFNLPNYEILKMKNIQSGIDNLSTKKG